MRRLIVVIEAVAEAAIEDALYRAVETAHLTGPGGSDVTDDGALVAWRWEDADAPGRTVVLTAGDETDLADALGDAYAYRLGESYEDDLEETDAEGLDRARRLGERLGIKLTP